MLAGIKISEGTSKHKDKKKKKKKSKHKKRRLKSKDSSSDSDSSASDDGEVVELKAASAAPSSSMVRDTWMTLPMKSPHMTAVLSDRAAKREAEEKKKQQDEEAREEIERQAKVGGLKGDTRPINEKSLTAAPLVGDGGAKWRAKALQRAQEKAREEGVDGETVIAERFGSLGAFKAKDRELKQELQSQRGYSDRSREEQRHRFQRGGGDGGESSQRGREDGGGGGRPSWRTKVDEGSRRREVVVPKAGQDEFGRDLGEGQDDASAKSVDEKPRVREDVGSSRQERWRRKDYVPNKEEEENDNNNERGERHRENNRERSKSPPRRRRSRDREEENDKRRDERGREKRDERDERDERQRDRHYNSRDNDQGEETTEKKHRGKEKTQDENDKEKAKAAQKPKEEKPLAERFETGDKPKSEEEQKKLARKLQKEAEQEKEIAERRAFLYATNRARSDATSEAKPVVPTKEEEEDDGVEVSEADINKMAARVLKAKLMGETDKATTLEQQLESMKRRKSRQPKVAVLSEMDAKGRLLNLKRPSGASKPEEEAAGGRKQKRVQNKIVDGERVAYFDDDVAKTDLKSLVEAERLRGSEDYDANWAKNIMKNADFKEVSLEQQWDDVDVSMKMFQSKKDRLQKDKRAEYAQKTQISEYNKLQRTLDNCRLCVAQAPQHLIIANGLRMYLSLPTHRIVTEGHCILAPMEHTPAVTHFDEDVLDEFQYFRKHLVKMFAKQGKGVVFMETYMHPERTPHAMIECVPLPLELFEEAAIYFKKEISDSDAKWSVHKKLIDTREKGLRRLVAKQAPYFNVEFGMEGGFAHVIEDTSKFPMDFGKSVLCGILEEPAQIVMRAKRQPEHVERERADAFRQKWKPFDWTLKLKKNQPQSAGREMEE